MASTRSTSAATLLTLWSTSSTARPSSRRPRISSENAATSPTVSPANGSSISTTFGSRAIALAISIRRRSANGSVAGWRCITSPRPTRRAISRARSSMPGAATSRSSESGSSASLMFSSTVWRCSGRECWNTMPTPARAIRYEGQPATSTPSSATEPASGRSMPITSFITVDLPEPLGPIKPRISPPRSSKPMSLTATSPPKRLVRPRTASRTAPLTRSPAGAARARAGRRGRTGSPPARSRRRRTC